MFDVLGDLGATRQSNAYGINNSGQIVGFTGVGNAFIYDSASGTVKDLWGDGGAYAINDKGQVVGCASGYPVLYNNGVVQNLGVLGDLPPITGWNTALAINNAGQVVGNSYLTSDPWSSHAFIWQNGVMQDLNELIGSHPDFTLVEARGINSKGQIIANGWHEAYLLTPNDSSAVPLPSALSTGLLLFGILGMGRLSRVIKRRHWHRQTA